MGLIALGGIEQRGGVEVAVMARNKLRDRAFARRERGVEVLGAFGLTFRFHSIGEKYQWTETVRDQKTVATRSRLATMLDLCLFSLT